MSTLFRHITGLLVVIVLLSGCDSVPHSTTDNSKEQVPTSPSIPEYFPRNQNIGSFAEQEQMFKTYVDLKQAIQTDPTNYRKRLQLAQLFMLEARATGEHGHYYPATLTVLDELIGANPPKDIAFGARSLKASVMLSLHEFQQARDLAKEAIALNGHNALIYGSLVDANVELGNYQEAVQMADRMVSIRPDLRSYSRISYLREIHGDMLGAIQAMKMAIESGYPGYEDRAWCRLTLGGIYEDLDQLDSAAYQYKMALAERENYPFAQAALAGLHARAGDFAKAEAELKMAIASIPEVGFYEQLAALYQETDRPELAAQTIEEIMVMLADDEAAGHRMGIEYANIYLHLLDDATQALSYAQAEYERRPDNIDVNRLMADILQHQGHLEEAKPYADKATRI